jgi:tetratricopeptide (TPR) repeat protein
VEAEGVAALDKNSTEAYLLTGEAYASLNQPRKASQALRTALVLDPFNIQVHQRYREAKSRDIDAEIEALKEKVSAPLELAKLYLAKGQHEEAVRELQNQRTPGAFNLLGNIYRSEGRYEMAAAQYNRVLEGASPELSRVARFNLGTVHEAIGQVRKAIKLYEGIMQEDIDFGNLKKRVKQLKTTSLQSMRNRPLQVAVFEYGKKELIGFWGREPRLSARSAGKEEVSVSFGQEHNQEGVELFFKGMFTAAEEEFSLAVQLDRSFSTALNNLGAALARQGKLEEARLKLNEAVQLDPASVVFYNNLGVVLFLIGRYEAAQVSLEKSLALDPESAAVCLNLGDVYYWKKDARRAIELYRRIGQFDFLSDLAGNRLLYTVP